MGELVVFPGLVFVLLLVLVPASAEELCVSADVTTEEGTSVENMTVHGFLTNECFLSPSLPHILCMGDPKGKGPFCTDGFNMWACFEVVNVTCQTNSEGVCELCFNEGVCLNNFDYTCSVIVATNIFPVWTDEDRISLTRGEGAQVSDYYLIESSKSGEGEQVQGNHEKDRSVVEDRKFELKVRRKPDPVCGDDNCERYENSDNCCDDCGCPDSLICMDNQCVEAVTECDNFTITSSETGEPASGVTIVFWDPHYLNPYGPKCLTDERGSCQICEQDIEIKQFLVNTQTWDGFKRNLCWSTYNSSDFWQTAPREIKLNKLARPIRVILLDESGEVLCPGGKPFDRLWYRIGHGAIKVAPYSPKFETEISRDGENFKPFFNDSQVPGCALDTSVSCDGDVFLRVKLYHPYNLNKVKISKIQNFTISLYDYWQDIYLEKEIWESVDYIATDKLSKPVERVEVERSAFCGNLLCEDGETSENCCLDCGCAREQECISSTCKKKSKLTIVFVPVNWKENQSLLDKMIDFVAGQSWKSKSFDKAVDEQTQLFLEATGLNECKDEIEFKIDYEGCNIDLSCSCEDLNKIAECVAARMSDSPGNIRIVAFTNRNFGEFNKNCKNVLGYTCSASSVVLRKGIVLSETQQVQTMTHELGHTFGLCDEYNYTVWENQDANGLGCPNQFPTECKKDPLVWCEGESCGPNCKCIMGPGLRGNVRREFGPNCKKWLREKVRCE